MSILGKVLGVIPARMASTRFPGKPLALIKGKSLVQRTYENAARCPLFGALVVATDHPDIYQHVLEFGGNAVMTSSNCSTGTDRIAEVVQQADSYADYSIVCNIQGDEPCVESHIFVEVCQALEAHPEAVMATARTPLLSATQAASRSIVKCVTNLKGQALYFSRVLIPAGHHPAFHQSVHYYRHIGLYAFRREFLLLYPTLPMTPLQEAEDLEMLKILEHGYPIQVVTVDEPTIGVDTPEDLIQVEEHLCRQNLP